MKPGAWLLTGPETIETCRACSTVLTDTYWRVNGSAHCAACALTLRRAETAYLRRNRLRGLLFGLAAATLSCIPISWSIPLLRHIPASALLIWDLGLWAFTALTLLLGALLGAAVATGAHQTGGRFLQTTAAILTYLTYAEALAAETILSTHPHATTTLPTHLPADTTHLALSTLLRLLAPAPAAPILNLHRSLLALPGLIAIAAAMLLAWQLNPEGKRLALSGPFHCTQRALPRKPTRHKP